MIIKQVIGLVALSLCSIGLFVSCDTSAEVLPEQVDTSTSFSVRDVDLKDGLLVFKDEESFWEAVGSATELDDETYEAWALSQGFSSLWSLYNEFFNYSVASAEKGYDKSFDEIRAIYGKAVLLAEDGMFDLNCPNTAIAKMINEEGLVKVGEAIYQFNAEGYVRIEDGDMSKLPIALRMTESDPDQGIVVFNTQEAMPNRQVCSGVGFFPPFTAINTVFFNEWCWTLPAGSGPCTYKLRGEITNTQSSFRNLLLIELRGYRRGAFGIWFGYNSKKTITSTTADISGFTFNGVPVNFVNNNFGIGGNNNVLVREVFDTNDRLDMPLPIELLNGYQNTCIGFNIEFFHPFGPPQFISL